MSQNYCQRAPKRKRSTRNRAGGTRTCQKRRRVRNSILLHPLCRNPYDFDAPYEVISDETLLYKLQKKWLDERATYCCTVAEHTRAYSQQRRRLAEYIGCHKTTVNKILLNVSKPIRHVYRPCIFNYVSGKIDCSNLQSKFKAAYLKKSYNTVQQLEQTLGVSEAKLKSLAGLSDACSSVSDDSMHHHGSPTLLDVEQYNILSQAFEVLCLFPDSKNVADCCVCLESKALEKLGGCSHRVCHHCLQRLRQRRCPICRAGF